MSSKLDKAYWNNYYSSLTLEDAVKNLVNFVEFEKKPGLAIPATNGRDISCTHDIGGICDRFIERQRVLEDQGCLQDR